jgi:tetratricopeptide (TPR) repeat protein
MWGAVLAVGLLVAPAMGQGRGLDALSDDRLMAELAQRGLDSLLERAFEANKVPAEQRQATRALIALRELSDPAVRLSQQQRDEMVGRVVAGMTRALPQQRDARFLVDNAERLITAAVFRDLNTLEYWGESSAVMARLRPVASVVSDMLTRATELSRAAADDLANKITNPNDTAALERFTQLDQLATKAEFTRRINDYAVVLSTDSADPGRIKRADDAIAYLAQFDNAESSVMAVVRTVTGKLLASVGRQGDAVKVLDSVWADGSEVSPKPSAGQRFEARYFAAVAVLKSGDAAGARQRLDAMVPWVKELFAGEAGALPGAEAALMMLRYRVLAAAGGAGESEAARQALIDLVRARPEFEGAVLDQLAARIPENAEVGKLDPLLLRAMFRKGEIEQRRPEGVEVDKAALGQAVSAARELIARKGRPGVDAGLVEDVAIRLPLLLERAGQPLEAAVAALDFIEGFGTGHRNARAALDEAAFLIARLRRETPEDTSVAVAYDRLLSVAVAAPFSRVELAYEYARRLQQAGRFDKAIEMFALVPATDARFNLSQFFRMVSLKQLLDAMPAGVQTDARAARAKEVALLAGQIKAETRKRVGTAALTGNDQLIYTRASLVAADVQLRELRNPGAALGELSGFEQSTAGLESGPGLVAQAMQLRVLALMDQGKNQQATETLVTLLEKTGGDEGADIVFRLLTRLNEDFDRAKAGGNAEVVRSIARSRAQLSGYLVTWAEKHREAKIRDLTSRYRLFDADTKRLAADLETDAAARTAGLEAALKLYDGLQDPARPDPAVELGIALISYDLGRYERAREVLALLLNQRRLGRPTLEEDRNGELTAVPNERYWEAMYKLMASTVKLVEEGKAEASARDQTVAGLKALYARWGRGLGGTKFAGDIDRLRAAIAPDYSPPDLSIPVQP